MDVLKTATITGSLLVALVSNAHAQGFRVVVDSLTAVKLSDGEPGSEDEVFFALGAATPRGSVARMRIHPNNDDHWDIKEGQTISNLRLYEGFLGNTESGSYVFMLRESDGNVGGIISSSVNAALGTLQIIFTDCASRKPRTS